VRVRLQGRENQYARREAAQIALNAERLAASIVEQAVHEAEQKASDILGKAVHEAEQQASAILDEVRMCWRVRNAFTSKPQLRLGCGDECSG